MRDPLSKHSYTPPSIPASGDWPQPGHGPQLAYYALGLVNPPYCYTGKRDVISPASRDTSTGYQERR